MFTFMFISFPNRSIGTGSTMSVVDAVSKETVCTEEERKDGIYMVCKDKDGKVVLEKKLIAVG